MNRVSLTVSVQGEGGAPPAVTLNHPNNYLTEYPRYINAKGEMSPYLANKTARIYILRDD